MAHRLRSEERREWKEKLEWFHANDSRARLPESATSGSFGETAINRLARVKVIKLTRGRNIPLLHHILPNEPPLSLLKFTPIADIKKALLTQPPTFNMDLLWHTG